PHSRLRYSTALPRTALFRSYLSRARPVLVPGEPEWSLKVSVRDLDRVVPGARGLILCSPCNPTGAVSRGSDPARRAPRDRGPARDRKSTRLNSSHVAISYPV